MPPGNSIQFAVVREDPDIELALLEGLHPPGEALLVASGGCTGFTLAAIRPDVKLTLLDANSAQLELVERKIAALRTHGPGSDERARLFGVGRDDPTSLTGCGNFESLFRGFRAVLDDLVLPAQDRRRLLEGNGSADPLTKSKYWPVAFAMFLSDAFLEAMFGPDATQHAEKGSYPDYFRRALERGLARADRKTNYFLHHLLLGHYLETATPRYLDHAGPAQISLLHAPMENAPRFSRFSLIHLSNLFDWMDAPAVERICRRLSAECVPGTVLVLRQLNNRNPIERFLADAFRFDVARSDALLGNDRSLFYERLLVGVRKP